MEVHGTVKSFLKPPAGLALIHKFFNFDLDDKKKELQVTNNEMDLQNVVIYSVFNADQDFRVALGSPFQTALEVKRAVIAVKELLWNGFGSSFLDDCIL